MKTVLRSKPANVFLAKFWIPFLFGGIAVAMCSGDLFFPRSLFLASPFIAGVLFFFSLAVLEIQEGGVARYRRLFSWREIPFDDIVDARVEVPPVIASVRCRKFLFPWGRLYFVLDRNLDSNLFHEGEYALLSYIRNRKSQGVVEPRPTEPRADNRQMAKLSLAAIAGIVFFLLSRLLAGHTPYSSAIAPLHPVSASPLLNSLNRIIHVAALFRVQLALAILFAFLAIYRRRQQEAWIFAFLTGVSLPYVILHWIASL
jgi:hypothetical protein